jgi:hypothetical protein
MLGAFFIAPGSLLESATLGVVVACVLAVVTALFAIPAALAAVGTNIDRWQLWSSRGENPWVRLSERLSRKPGVAVLLTMFPLLLLTAPALALDTGPPNVQNLPPGDASRQSFEAFQRDRGAGWATPFEVDLTRGPTTPRPHAWLKNPEQVARELGIEAAGPASLLEHQLRSLTASSTGGRQLTRLEYLRLAERGPHCGLDAAAGATERITPGQAAPGRSPGHERRGPQTQQRHGRAADGGRSGPLSRRARRASDGSKELRPRSTATRTIDTERRRRTC